MLCGAPADAQSDYFRTVEKHLEFLPVDFLGWQDDIAAVLAELDLLVIASKAEGMPRVMLEAFSAGVPVVAFPVGGIPEVIRDGETGFLVRENTAASAWRRGIREVIAALLHCGDIAANARREWEQNVYGGDLPEEHHGADGVVWFRIGQQIREKESRQSRR